jgi:hypothetical protein
LMCDLGLRLLISPSMLDGSNMRLITTIMSNFYLASLMLLVGGARTCVMIRGEWFGNYVLHTRIILTVMACMIWGLMVFAFLQHFITSDRMLPPGFDMLTAQMVGELLVIYNLAREA